MDAREWLGLEPTHNPNRWILPVTPGISTPGNFLFGGCGLGAAIAALEGTTGRPLIWATAQYLSYAQPPSIVDIDVRVAAAGRSVTQARAVAHVGDTEILTVNAALGERDVEASGQWATRPDVEPPDDCPRRTRHRHMEGDWIMSRLEERVALRADGSHLDATVDGRSALWVRMPAGVDTSAATLGVLGDFVPGGIGATLARDAGGNSLDNTIRIARPVPTEWILLDIRIHAIANGFAHGLVHQWAEDGTLLGTASQSTIVRIRG
ncbi:acyl-CoA thioesterase [Actinomarinicola tropica]|uniref:Acyl-CoA thioesterase n=1 Tax=Actinomarinicola tropica TaxID=2789776 RepID=A0A5Q2RF27_9ACTN|nr:thioesterase family protein [Actinomarinicola tropica]QGG95458.1 acyl-CoA thioesterase [Actinomarinicola tropica]